MGAVFGLLLFSFNLYAAVGQGYRWVGGSNSQLFLDENEFFEDSDENIVVDLVCADWWTAYEEHNFGSTSSTFLGGLGYSVFESVTWHTREIQGEFIYCSVTLVNSGYPTAGNWRNGTHIISNEAGTLASDGAVMSPITGICLVEEVYVEYPGGTFADIIQEISVESPYCFDNCVAHVNARSIDSFSRVDSEDPASFGCTYDQSGYISNCHPSTPIVWVQSYYQNGDSCVEVTNSDPVLTQPFGNQNIDMSETNELIESTNEQLEELNTNLTTGGDQIETAEEMLTNSVELTEVTTAIQDIGTGSYKPFGDGLDSLFPTFTYNSGQCLLTNFNLEISGYTATVDMEQYCQYFDIIRSLFDMVFFLGTWIFVYRQFTLAMRDV